MKNAAIYIRVSTEREEQKISKRNQKELCMEIIKENNWPLHGTYEDEVSGLISDRPMFKKLLDDMEKGFIQVIVVKEGSRLARSVTTFEKIRELATKRNINLISVDGELDTFKKGYECITQIGADAQKEAERISKRVKNSIRMNAKRGEFTGSIAPYGYYIEDKKLYPRNDETVKVVQRIYYSYLNGKGAKSIAKELQDEQIPTPSMIARKRNATANWNDTTIYGILENEAYIGNLVQSVEETYFANEERKRKKKSEENIIRTDGTHTAIIPKYVFDDVQHLKASKPKSGAKAQHHLFSNILYCKDCGSKLSFKRGWGKGSYVCSTYSKKGAKYCSNHAVSENKLISKLSEELVKFNQLNFDVLSQKAERKLKQLIRKLDGQLSALQFEVRTIENRIDSLEDDIFDEPSKKSDLMHSIQKQRKKLSIKKAEITKIQTKIDYLKTPQTNSKVRKELMNAFEFKKFNLMTVNTFISKIDVNEDKTLEVHYRFSEAEAS
ncbi:recombinase family protein [Bacillus sp. CGMCC 1.16541]|uniref:recombinase family protein n=1 Tax=Bacillus sp. CGMCC 1.16541 TaxID=2185143 RepID=UPI000D72BB1A|nr:recombinase family protein [Bacillus sp. CGMCC 1.16541]